MDALNLALCCRFGWVHKSCNKIATEFYSLMIIFCLQELQSVAYVPLFDQFNYGACIFLCCL